MSIAVGYKFRDGVIIGADSEAVDGTAKFETSKISTIVTKGATLVCATAGHAGHINKVAAIIQAELQKLPNAKHRDIEEDPIRQCIDYAVAEVYQRFIFRHPGSETGQGPAAQFVIGLWSKGLGTALLLSNEDAVVDELYNFAVAGMGSSFARWIGGNLFRPDMSQAEAIRLAVHVLHLTKTNVIHCGMQTELWVLTNDGELTTVPVSQISRCEGYSDRFAHASNALFFDMARRRGYVKKTTGRTDKPRG